MTVYINGSGTSNTSYFSTSTTLGTDVPIQIGWSGHGGVGDQYFTGYLDEVRITKGIARYTSNFSVPTQPFPDQ